MRSATLTITEAGGGFHPADRALAAAADVYRDSILQINLLSDGTCVVLYVLQGNSDHASEVLHKQSTVIKHEVTGEEGGVAFIHFHPNDTVRKLLTILEDYEIILKTPVECLSDGVRVIVIGDDDAIQQAVWEVPDGLSLSLENISQYTHESDRPLSTLTDRQREILVTAEERGYYDIPRRTSHEELAEEMGLSLSTVCEHLRKAESKLITSLLTS